MRAWILGSSYLAGLSVCRFVGFVGLTDLGSMSRIVFRVRAKVKDKITWEQ